MWNKILSYVDIHVWLCTSFLTEWIAVWVTENALWCIFWRRKWQPTPVLLPGKSHGWKSVVGYSPWGHKESDTTERLHFTHFILSHWRRKWQPTPVLLPGKSHGWKSVVGYSPWGCKESDTTEWLHFLSFLLSQKECVSEGMCLCSHSVRKSGSYGPTSRLEA